MKTFKQHLSEHSKSYSRQWMDQDTMPSAANALEALNSFIGQIAEHEYLNPQVGIEKLQSGLGKLGYHFDAPTLEEGSGQYSVSLRYGNGTFEVNRDEDPYGEFKEGDGISDHIEGGVSLVIDITKTANGKSLMNSQLVRNADKG